MSGSSDGSGAWHGYGVSHGTSPNRTQPVGGTIFPSDDTSAAEKAWFAQETSDYEQVGKRQLSEPSGTGGGANNSYGGAIPKKSKTFKNFPTNHFVSGQRPTSRNVDETERNSSEDSRPPSLDTWETGPDNLDLPELPTSVNPLRGAKGTLP